MHLDYKQPDFYHFSEDSTRLVAIATEHVPNAHRTLDLCAGSGIIGIEYALRNTVSEIHFSELQKEFRDSLSFNQKFLKNILNLNCS